MNKWEAEVLYEILKKDQKVDCSKEEFVSLNKPTKKDIEHELYNETYQCDIDPQSSGFFDWCCENA